MGMYSIENGVAKELTCMTRGHEQWWRDCLMEWGVAGWMQGKGRKKGTTIIA